VDKIDKNHDGSVTERELRNWIRYQQKFYILKYSEDKWKKINSNSDSFLTFDELIENTIGGADSCKIFCGYYFFYIFISLNFGENFQGLTKKKRNEKVITRRIRS
jgi:hypothetical protein